MIGNSRQQMQYTHGTGAIECHVIQVICWSWCVLLLIADVVHVYPQQAIQQKQIHHLVHDVVLLSLESMQTIIRQT